MGTNDGQRRAADTRGTGRLVDVDRLLDELATMAGVVSLLDGRLVDELRRADPAEVRGALVGRLLDAVATAWERGWQPIDLDRYLARRAADLEPTLVRAVLAEDAGTYAGLGRRVAPAWMAQLAALHVVPAAAGELEAWFSGRAPADALPSAVDLLATLTRLFELPRLVDPPSAWVDDGREGRAPEDVPAPLLARIRALLAKAESTEFSAEAEAFTAKAQELMARHRVDRALLDDREPTERLADGVVGRRIAIDDPYATAKFHLLAGIAEVNGARTVWSKAIGMATVFGFPVEVDVIEELFTSLLVQATSAVQREGSKVDSWGRSRTKAFRRSFLLAFGDRIAHRLSEAVAGVVDEASSDAGTDLLPVLAARAEAVAAKVDELFPRLRSMSASISDAEGVFAGRLAADRADLSAGPRLDRHPA